MCAQHSPRQCVNPPWRLAGANRGETAAHRVLCIMEAQLLVVMKTLTFVAVGTPPIEIAN